MKKIKGALRYIFIVVRSVVRYAIGGRNPPHQSQIASGIAYKREEVRDEIYTIYYLNTAVCVQLHGYIFINQ